MARRRKKHEEHANHEAWAIPYGDLITLLLAFFVVMYAISSVNEGKFRVLSDSLQAAFRGAPKTLDPVQVGEKTRGSGADIAVSIVQQANIEGQPRQMLDLDRRVADHVEQRAALGQLVQGAVQPLALAGDLEFRGAKTRLAQARQDRAPVGRAGRCAGSTSSSGSRSRSSAPP